MPSASVSLYAPRAVTQVQSRYVGGKLPRRAPTARRGDRRMATNQKAGYAKSNEYRVGEGEGESIPSEESSRGAAVIDSRRPHVAVAPLKDGELAVQHVPGHEPEDGLIGIELRRSEIEEAQGDRPDQQCRDHGGSFRRFERYGTESGRRRVSHQAGGRGQ